VYKESVMLKNTTQSTNGTVTLAFAQSPGHLIQSPTSIQLSYLFLLTRTCIIVLFLLIDLSDVHLDDDEKENISPDDLPAFVTIDTFGESFEEAVSISLSIFIICLSP